MMHFDIMNIIRVIKIQILNAALNLIYVIMMY